MTRYAAEILVKERLGDLRRTAESLRSRDGRPRPLTPGRRPDHACPPRPLAVMTRRPARGSRAGLSGTGRPACRTCPCERAREDRRDAREGVRDERDPDTGERSMNFVAIEMLNG